MTLALMLLVLADLTPVRFFEHEGSQAAFRAEQGVG